MRRDSRIDFGTIQIHKKVLVDIALSALNEFDGVALAHSDVSGKLMAAFGKKNTSGIDVLIDKNNQVNMEIRIRVKYGLNILDLARQVQEVVRSAVEKTTNIQLNEIHVNVQSIERGQE